MDNNIDFKWSRFFLSMIIFIYIIACTLITLKVFIMTWVGNFSFLTILIPEEKISIVEEPMKLAIFTIMGALLGGSTLGITSLHKHAAITKKLDIDHLWGYLMAPILSVIIGILIFGFLFSGLMVLTGGNSGNTGANGVKIGYLSMGAICSYNWDVFIMKLQKLSQKIPNE